MLARRLLVESAWHYERAPMLGATLAERQADQPDHILAISNRAQQRLYKVNRGMKARGKPHNVTVVACARQLAGVLWLPRPPTNHRLTAGRSVGRGAGPSAAGTRDTAMSNTRRRRASRSFLESTSRQHETGP